MPDVPTDSPVLLYGILASEARENAALKAVLNGSGVRDAPLMLLPCGPLAVLASPLADRSALRQPDVDTVLAYKETIDAAYEARPLVPLRFGTWAQSPDGARTLITERAAACEKQLDKLAGRVEMGLRVTLEQPVAGSAAEATDASSGTAYLQARKEQREQTQAPLRRACKHYRDALDALVVDTAVHEPGTDDPVASLAFLVPRPNIEAVEEQAEKMVPDAVNVQVIGPWAPFTFASLSL